MKLQIHLKKRTGCQIVQTSPKWSSMSEHKNKWPTMKDVEVHIHTIETIACAKISNLNNIYVVTMFPSFFSTGVFIPKQE